MKSNIQFVDDRTGRVVGDYFTYVPSEGNIVRIPCDAVEGGEFSMLVKSIVINVREDRIAVYGEDILGRCVEDIIY